MDEPDAGAKPDPKELDPRPPLEADLVGLCRELNKRGARYIVIGGFAVITAGLLRATGDIDLMVAVDRVTHREKDAGDLVFPRYWFSEHGERPPI